MGMVLGVDALGWCSTPSRLVVCVVAQGTVLGVSAMGLVVGVITRGIALRVVALGLVVSVITSGF